jgi:hypothetical protein
MNLQISPLSKSTSTMSLAAESDFMAVDGPVAAMRAEPRRRFELVLK